MLSPFAVPLFPGKWQTGIGRDDSQQSSTAIASLARAADSCGGFAMLAQTGLAKSSLCIFGIKRMSAWSQVYIQLYQDFPSVRRLAFASPVWASLNSPLCCAVLCCVASCSVGARPSIACNCAYPATLHNEVHEAHDVRVRDASQQVSLPMFTRPFHAVRIHLERISGSRHFIPLLGTAFTPRCKGICHLPLAQASVPYGYSG